MAALVVGAVSLAQVARVVALHGRRFATEDGALLWYAAREAGHGRVHGPTFYGQSYGTIAETVPALAVRRLTGAGFPASQAVTTALLFAIGWWLVAAVAWRAGRRVLALLALAAPAAFTLEYQVLGAAPRGFAVALPLAVAGALVAVLHRSDGPTGGEDASAGVPVAPAVPTARPARLALAGALLAIAVAWDVSTALVALPVAAWVAVDLVTRRDRRRLLAFAAGATPGVAFAAVVAAYFRAHPDENLSERGGFGVRLDVLAHNLAHLDAFVALVRPEAVRWWPIPLVGGLVALAVLAARGARARSWPTLAGVATVAMLVVWALATPKSLNYNEQAYLPASRFLLGAPVVLVLLLAWSPRPVRRVRPARPSTGPTPSRPPSTTVATACACLLAAVSVPTAVVRAPDRLRGIVATTRSASEGVDLRATAKVERRCDTLARGAARTGSDLVVFTTDLVATYACPALTGGRIETLHPSFERRVWRLRDELARTRTALTLADVPDSFCDGVPGDVAACRPLGAPASGAVALRFPAQTPLLLLQHLGVPIQRFDAPDRALVPVLCARSRMTVTGEPPSAAPGADRSLRARLTVDLPVRSTDVLTPLRARVTVQNIGTQTWRAEVAPLGRVRLGVHLLDADGRLLDLDYLHVSLGRTVFRRTAPGEVVRLSVAIPPPPAGTHILEFDLVSEGVTWFAARGSATVRRTVETRCPAAP